jgi:hypothetical protein
VRQLIADFEDLDEVNKQLDQMWVAVRFLGWLKAMLCGLERGGSLAEGAGRE